nr:hypothetical protein [Tetrasphaera sp. HKS02]
MFQDHAGRSQQQRGIRAWRRQRLGTHPSRVGSQRLGLGAARRARRGHTQSRRQNAEPRRDGQQDPKPAVRPLFPAHLCRLGLPFGCRGLLRGLEERCLARRQQRLVCRAPLQRTPEADSAVQLAVGAAHGVPGFGGHRQVAQDPLTLHVLVEPRAQPWPFPGQRLVGDLHRLVVGRDEPGRHELLHQGGPRRIVGDQAAPHT